MIDLNDCHQNSLLCKFKTIYVPSQILIKKKLVFIEWPSPNQHCPILDAWCVKAVLRWREVFASLTAMPMASGKKRFYNC